MDEIAKYSNIYWKNTKKVKVSIITPVFNRCDVIYRPLESIRKQTFRNIEHIIVDDGSTDQLDQKIFKYMNDVDYPVLYIKQNNGGVHTARNTGLRNSKGDFILHLDSDDEYVPNAIEILINTWDSIPDINKNNYYEVIGQCQDIKGKRVGNKFPNNINDLSFHKAIKIKEKTNGEHFGFRVSEKLKEFYMPEPQGVKFVCEDIQHCYFYKKYKSYFINDMLRIYHMDGNDHLTNAWNKVSRKVTYQDINNSVWEYAYVINNWDIYKNNYHFNYIELMVRYCAKINILKIENCFLINEYNLYSLFDNIIKCLLLLPTRFIAIIYIKYRMK